MCRAEASRVIVYIGGMPNTSHNRKMYSLTGHPLPSEFTGSWIITGDKMVFVTGTLLIKFIKFVKSVNLPYCQKE